MSQKKGTILVVAERFPAINQPWIDTCIEELLVNSFRVMIYSSNRKPGIYHAKVDYLNLRRHLINFNLSHKRGIYAIIKSAAIQPGRFYGTIGKARKVGRYLCRKYQLEKWPTYFKLIRFGIEETNFSGIDIIHAHSEHLAFEFLFLALMKDLPLIYTFHGLLPKGVNSLHANKRKALYGEVRQVLVNTVFGMRQLLERGCISSKVEILPQGLPFDEFTFAPQPCPEGREMLHLLTVGRFHRDKGHGFALIAVARLIRSGLTLKYHIVGGGPDRSRIQHLIERLGLTNHVSLEENLKSEGLLRLYRQAHIFILPSINNNRGEHIETQGVVLQEAQASGCIPIATRVGGIPECIHDKVDAILVKEKSSKAICDGVRYLLARPKEWRTYQENGRRNVELRFSAKIIGRRMASIFREAIGKERGKSSSMADNK